MSSARGVPVSRSAREVEPTPVPAVYLKGRQHRHIPGFLEASLVGAGGNNITGRKFCIRNQWDVEVSFDGRERKDTVGRDSNNGAEMEGGSSSIGVKLRGNRSKVKEAQSYSDLLVSQP